VRYSDLYPGKVIVVPTRRTVTEQEIVEFARRYDPQWFHVDPKRATRSRWKGLISSGWLTCSLAMELLVPHVLADSESIGGPGLEYLKWPHPLRPGDEVMLKVEVLERRLSKTGALGIVRWRWLLLNQSGAQVMDLVSTNLFELQPGTQR